MLTIHVEETDDNADWIKLVRDTRKKELAMLDKLIEEQEEEEEQGVGEVRP